MTDYSIATDEELFRLTVEGVEAAFVALYRRRQASIYRFALNMSGSAAIAEEAVQDVFLAVIRQRTLYDPAKGSATAYLYGIARNYVLRGLKKDRKFSNRIEETENDLVCSAELVLSGLTREETAEAVRQAVLSLPEIYREAVVLCDLEELSYNQAAETLDVPVGTVRSRLNRGRALLAQKLKSASRCIA